MTAAGITLLLWALWATAWFWLAFAGSRRQAAAAEDATVAADHGHLYRPLNIVAGLLILAALAIQAVQTRMGAHADELASMVGVAIVAVGLGFCLICRLQLGRYWTGLVGTTATHRLVDGGIYNFVRHPIYLGVMVALAGTLVVSQSILTYAGLLIAYLSITYKIHLEEQHLLSTIGSDYLAYLRRVPALLPIRLR